MARRPSTDDRLRLELVPPDRVGAVSGGPNRVAIRFRIVNADLDDVGRMAISLVIKGDPHGVFAVTTPHGDARWEGEWAVEAGRVVVEKLTVYAAEVDAGVTKQLLRDLPTHLVSDAVTSMVTGAARGVLDDYAPAIQPRSAGLSELIRALFLADTELTTRRPSGRGRPPTSDQRRRQQAIDVCSLSQARDKASLYEALADKWSAAEGHQIEAETARSRVHYLITHKWLQRLDRGAFALGPRFTSTGEG